jgi:acetyltransferase
MVRFHRDLSADTVYSRYFAALGLDRRIAHDRLVRVCFGDYERELALVAEHEDPAGGEREIVAVGRLSKTNAPGTAEFAILVADRFQHHGLGSELLRRLVDAGRDEGLARIVAEMLPTNGAMIRISEKLGFSISRSSDEVTAELRLR